MVTAAAWWLAAPRGGLQIAAPPAPNTRVPRRNESGPWVCAASGALRSPGHATATMTRPLAIFRRAAEGAAMVLGLGLLAVICLTWTPFAMVLGLVAIILWLMIGSAG